MDTVFEVIFMNNELPMSFAMALAMNQDAMRNFEALSRDEKASVMQRSHGVNSRQEMWRLVGGLAGRADGLQFQ